MRLDISPIPIGLMPGCLSSAIRWQATKEEMHTGSTKEQQILLAVQANASQRSDELWANDVQSLLQAEASKTEGPAEPSVLKATFRISSPLS